MGRQQQNLKGAHRAGSQITERRDVTALSLRLSTGIGILAEGHFSCFLTGRWPKQGGYAAVYELNMALLHDLAARVAALESQLAIGGGIATQPPVPSTPGRLWPTIYFTGSSDPRGATFAQAIDEALQECSAWLRAGYNLRFWFEWTETRTSDIPEAEWTADLWGSALRHVAPTAGRMDIVIAYCGGAPGFGGPLMDGRAGLAVVSGAILERIAMIPVAERRFASDPALFNRTFAEDRQSALGLLLHEVLHASGCSVIDRDPADGFYDPHPIDAGDIMHSTGHERFPEVTISASDVAILQASGFATPV